MYKKISQELLAFIKESPTAFHTVKNIEKELKENGFIRLWEEEMWDIVSEGKYYVIRNDSSIIAFYTGAESVDYSYHIVAVHSDSPTFKIKENAELEVRKKYIQLNTEGYGGMLCSTWFDRPLSVAGRIIIKNGGRLESKLINIDRDMLLIPSVAIHMNRKANEGLPYNKQIDMAPLFGGEACKKGDFKKIIGKEYGISETSIYGSDLYLYNRNDPVIWGAKEEFVSAPRLDDLQCTFAALKAFLKGNNQKAVNIYACFDNEEVGSGTKQGAASTFLHDVLKRMNSALGKSEENYYRAVASGFMISADNAHAVHPNHPELTDVENCVYMNEGIVIKSHAGQKYTSDAVSTAVFRSICEKAGVPVQYFANRSDQAGGSTLGNISSSKVSMSAVDIGLAQLAMHSAYETAGIRDTEYMIKAIETFYNVELKKYFTL